MHKHISYYIDIHCMLCSFKLTVQYVFFYGYLKVIGEGVQLLLTWRYNVIKQNSGKHFECHLHARKGTFCSSLSPEE